MGAHRAAATEPLAVRLAVAEHANVLDFDRGVPHLVLLGELMMSNKSTIQNARMNRHAATGFGNHTRPGETDCDNNTGGSRTRHEASTVEAM